MSITAALEESVLTTTFPFSRPRGNVRPPKSVALSPVTATRHSLATLSSNSSDITQIGTKHLCVREALLFLLLGAFSSRASSSPCPPVSQIRQAQYDRMSAGGVAHVFTRKEKRDPDERDWSHLLIFEGDSRLRKARFAGRRRRTPNQPSRRCLSHTTSKTTTGTTGAISSVTSVSP